MFDYNATEAEYIENNIDTTYESTRELEIERVQEDRRRRERKLVGRCVVVTNSRYQSGMMLFLQDGCYGDGYWTKFISNAKGFDESAAIIKAKNLRHGNPRVMMVQPNGKLKEVYSNGKRTR